MPLQSDAQLKAYLDANIDTNYNREITGAIHNYWGTDIIDSKLSKLTLTTKGDLHGFSTINTRLAVGANDKILSADSGESTGLKWVDAYSSPLKTKGDLLTHSDVDVRLGIGTNGYVLTADSAESTGMKWGELVIVDKLGITIDGGGGVITTGIKGDIQIPFDCVIEEVTMLADQSGSIVIDIWKDTYANYPPTDADSITASATPTISTAIKSQDTSLTGWSKSITAGDTIRFNVDSCTSIVRCTLILKIIK